MYKVVEFIEENTVYPIPVIWLKPDTATLKYLTYWPPTNDDFKIRKYAIKQTVPDETWNTYKYRQIGHDCDTYEEAAYKAKMAEITSDVSGTESRERVIVPPKRYRESDTRERSGNNCKKICHASTLDAPIRPPQPNRLNPTTPESDEVERNMDAKNSVLLPELNIDVTGDDWDGDVYASANMASPTSYDMTKSLTSLGLSDLPDDLVNPKHHVIMNHVKNYLHLNSTMSQAMRNFKDKCTEMATGNIEDKDHKWNPIKGMEKILRYDCINDQFERRILLSRSDLYCWRKICKASMCVNLCRSNKYTLCDKHGGYETTYLVVLKDINNTEASVFCVVRRVLLLYSDVLECTKKIMESSEACIEYVKKQRFLGQEPDFQIVYTGMFEGTGQYQKARIRHSAIVMFLISEKAGREKGGHPVIILAKRIPMSLTTKPFTELCDSNGFKIDVESRDMYKQRKMKEYLKKSKLEKWESALLDFDNEYKRARKGEFGETKLFYTIREEATLMYDDALPKYIYSYMRQGDVYVGAKMSKTNGMTAHYHRLVSTDTSEMGHYQARVREMMVPKPLFRSKYNDDERILSEESTTQIAYAIGQLRGKPIKDITRRDKEIYFPVHLINKWMCLPIFNDDYTELLRVMLMKIFHGKLKVVWLVKDKWKHNLEVIFPWKSGEVWRGDEDDEEFEVSEDEDVNDCEVDVDEM